MDNFGHYTISGCSQPPCKWCDLPYNLLLLGTYLIIPSSTRSGKQLLYQLETLRMRRIFILRSLSQYRLSTILYHTVLNIIYKMQVPLTSQIAKDSLLTGQEQARTRITRLFVSSIVCYHAENGLIHSKMVVDCPIVIPSIGDTLFQTIPNQE